jgi:hypothetical protein
MNKNDGFTVESHFKGKDPIVRMIYRQLLKAGKKFGPVTEEAKKTSIHLVNVTAFAGVATRKHAIVLTLKSDRQLSSPRIHRSERASANRFHHEVKLTLPGEVDTELTRWLRDAYSLSG